MRLKRKKDGHSQIQGRANKLQTCTPCKKDGIVMLTRWESWWCLGNGGWMCRWSSRCATVHWVTAPGKIALRAQSLHHLAYCTAPWYLHCLTCTRFYTWYRHTLPPAAFYLSFSFTHFDVKLLCFLFFGSRFGHNLWHFILASIKILISTFRQHSTP